MATKSTDIAAHDCKLAPIPATEFVWDGVLPVYTEFKSFSEQAIPLEEL
jgi:hypothetical protein